MDDGGIELSDHMLLPTSDSSSNLRASFSSDLFVVEFFRNTQTCTHTHTCNPLGDAAHTHTHTCYRSHFHVIPSERDDERSLVSETWRPLGNREAVRKYREKKEAHSTYLEEEVKKLRLANELQMGKLQRQSVLEAEAARLRSLLLDLQGKMHSEMGVFPFGKQSNSISTFTKGECGVQPSPSVDNLACSLAVYKEGK